MEQIVVTHKGGGSVALVSRQRPSVVTKAEQSITLLGADVVNITVKSAVPIEFEIGDTISIFARTYTLNQLPQPKKTGARIFEYSLTFESKQYDLIDATFLLPAGTMTNNYTGDASDWLALVVSNANRINPGGWSAGTCPAGTEYKTNDYSGKNCLEVIQDICDQYDTEFEIEETDGVKTISLKSAGSALPYTFKYGRTGGAYQIERANVNNKNVVTRLYTYGSSSNLGSGYRHSRLCLPGCEKNASYVEDADAVAQYGVRENVYIDDTIKPERVGIVSSLVDNTILSFVDTTMDFDLNEKDENGNTLYLIAGTSAKVQFTTGNLAGYEFEVHSYDAETKKITIVQYIDDNGLKFPNEDSAALRFAVGDKYIFTDINVPQSYKDNAEARLKTSADAKYAQDSQPGVQYSIKLTPSYLASLAGSAGATNTNIFAVGDSVKIQDDDIGVDKTIRITAFTRNILKPYEYDLTLSDEATKSTITRVIADLRKINTIIEINALNDASRARRNLKTAQEVLSMVFDPDGDYYSDKIKPLSIETTMLSLGAKSQQFTLSGITFETNYLQDPNAVHSSSGSLTHFAIESANRIWIIASNTTTELTAGNAYYIYAKCARTADSTSGAIIYDTTQHKVDAEADYYYFLIGTLSSVITDEDGSSNPARIVSLTYGSSTLNGRFIKTGRIQSADGLTFFDLDTGVISGKITFTNDAGTQQEIADYINNDLAATIAALQTGIDNTIDLYYYTVDPTTTSEPASSWTTDALKDQHLGDIYYNTAKGYAWRWYKSGSTYGWQQLKDQDVASAYTLATNASSTANSAAATAATKNRVYLTQPAPPYCVGDSLIYNGLLYTCNSARSTGSFTWSDWSERLVYTDDSALTTFLNGYTGSATDLAGLADGKITSWFQVSDPSSAWTEKNKHLGDLWYNGTSKTLKRFSYASSGYYWQTIEDQTAIDAATVASNALAAVDGKIESFYTSTETDTPTPPYGIGDIWFDTYHNTIKRCVTAKSSGSYAATDWSDAAKFESSAEFENWKTTEYQDALENIQSQVDGKITSWFQDTDPSSSWNTAALQLSHSGDMWYSVSTKALKRYSLVSGTYTWITVEDQKAVDAYANAAAAQDIADGKRRVFTTTPYPPYDVGDLWSGGSSGDLKRCNTAKSSGSYAASDWELATKYTDDTNLNTFVNVTFLNYQNAIANQLDGMVEESYTDTDPSSSWTTISVREEHLGDMWYKPSTNTLYQYTYNSEADDIDEIDKYYWRVISDANVLAAYAIASTAKSTADGKRRVFVVTPTPPYDVGDLWLTGGSADGTLKRCVTAKSSGSYDANNWVLAVYYDNTKTVIDGGIVTSGTVRLAGDDLTIKAGITGNGTDEESVRIWAGASEENKNTAPFRVLQNGALYATNATIVGTDGTNTAGITLDGNTATSVRFWAGGAESDKASAPFRVLQNGSVYATSIYASGGSIGGIDIHDTYLGVGSTASGESSNGFSLYSSFICFASGTTRRAMLGTNVFPATTGEVALARLTNTAANSYTNYGIYVDTENGAKNIAVKAIGNIVAEGIVQSSSVQVQAPSGNIILGYNTAVQVFNITVSGQWEGLPSRYVIAAELGISSTTPFAVPITIIGGYTSTQKGYVYGPSSSNTYMNDAKYPYRISNAGAIVETGYAIEKGDVLQFMLVFDGSNYRAYTLNVSYTD